MYKSGFIRSSLYVMIMGAASSTFAVDLTVYGEGKAPITSDTAVTRQSSLQAAKKDAVLAAIKKINGPEAANDPKVLGILDDITKQVGDVYIQDQKTNRDAANNLVTTVTLKLDDKDFRKLVSDEGIAIKTANSYPILVVMDEYFTTPTDKQKPLKEVVEFFSDQSSHLKLKDSESEAAAAGSSRYASSNGAMYANRSGAASYAGGGGYASGYGSATVAAKERSQSGATSFAASKSSSNLSVDAGQNDVVSYKKVVEYQPQNVGPSNQSYTYEAIMREASSYDLSIIDNSLFRSKYFKNKPLTLQQLTDGSELAHYVSAAHDDAKADYFMAGTTIIYDMGRDSSTSQSTCDGVVTLKAYSTTDGKLLATDARSESASGMSSDQCRVNVANKLASFTASVLGSQIGDYWKNRNMYGQQYTVQLLSSSGQLNFQLKRNFTNIITSLKGVTAQPVKRTDDARQVEYSLQYGGSTPIGDAIGDLVSTADAFKAYPHFDVNTTGTNVRICLESACPAK